ncbi:MAG: glycosyltransferase family 2 protein, partial [Niabella sp.]|nr:glycosyltransferase family 2 protein [Niabella sp.]
MTKPGISVIICTYNGVLKLPETLGYLARQEVGKRFEWEIVFVDNNSQDRSAEAAEEIWRNQNTDVPLLICQEPTPGKYYALQTAIAKARYDYFIVCDDDNGLNPDYLSRAFDLLNAHPEVGAVGGYARLKLPNGVKAPEWLPADYEPYALGKQAEGTGYVPLKKSRLWGAGLVSRTNLYKEVYAAFPSLLIEVPEERALNSEDTEFCARLILKGYQLYYDGNLELQHLLNPAKLTVAHRQTLNAMYNGSGAVIDRYRIA